MEYIRLLLDYGANVNYVDYGCTLLCEACKNKDMEFCILLIQYGADMSTVCSNKYIRRPGCYTLLCRACKAGNLNLVKIITVRTVIDAEYKYGNKKIIDIAAKSGFRDIVRYLVEFCNATSSKSVYYACKYGWCDVLDYLLTLEPYLNCIPNPLWIACKEGYVDIVTRLLASSTNVEIKFKCLAIAVEKGFLSIVQQLYSYGINYIENATLNPLFIACKNQDVAMVDFLLSVGYCVEDLNYSKETLLIMMCRRLKPNIEIIKLLIAAGSDVNAIFENNSSLLYICKRKQHSTRIAQLLIFAGADVNYSNSLNGITPLMLAAKWNNLELVKSLMIAGADKNLVDATGLTAKDYTKKKINMLD